MINSVKANRNSPIKKIGFSLIIVSVLIQSRVIAQSNNYNTPTNSADVVIEDVVIETDPPNSPPPTPFDTSLGNERFICQLERGRYTVMYYPQNQDRRLYPWAIPSELGSGWTAQRRCNEISRRLEMYRPDGLLELKTGRENNYDTICVTTQQNRSCRIILTIPPGKNPEITRNEIFQTLIAAEEGQYTQGVNAFTDGNTSGLIINQLGRIFHGNLPRQNNPSPSNNAIDLRPFLDPSDGGTGFQLRDNPTSVRTKPSSPWMLELDKFR
ncbi:MAG: COP23 domain-containing protein [cyanobacterium endosymbiont of Rhopalodia musculus]|uniref:COP23 domain-containing protein n=1 Tax=cyanobacterium endosymbiont of Epithemia clementina EcSB TaxID=3034674 RepID=UPI00248077B8|nr:COP23 domain-containing protein [cyanobacterium endosymbiont of Epithemia clementina EcSB]WGT67344.1 COP23 domain-containing protein [cyanobacterium endosymbiont of Epithemia clementina EcSB]